MFQGVLSGGVSGVLHGCFRSVQVCFREYFRGNLLCVSGVFKNVLDKFPGYFRGFRDFSGGFLLWVLNVGQGCYNCDARSVLGLCLGLG